MHNSKVDGAMKTITVKLRKIKKGWRCIVDSSYGHHAEYDTLYPDVESALDGVKNTVKLIDSKMIESNR